MISFHVVYIHNNADNIFAEYFQFGINLFLATITFETCIVLFQLRNFRASGVWHRVCVHKRFFSFYLLSTALRKILRPFFSVFASQSICISVSMMWKLENYGCYDWIIYIIDKLATGIICIGRFLCDRNAFAVNVDIFAFSHTFPPAVRRFFFASLFLVLASGPLV